MNLTHDHNIDQIILKTTQDLFFNRGYRNISMDEIASSVAMSKKTLYKFYKAKNLLLESVLLSFTSNIEKGFQSILDSGNSSFREKLFEIVSFITLELQQISTAFLEDIKKSAPNHYKIIDDIRQEKIPHFFVKLLEEGKQEGIVRSDVNIPLVTQILIASIQSILSQSVLVKLKMSPQEAFESIVTTIFNGLTD